MFKPKHTLKSVAGELVEGLTKGTIVLREELLPQERADKPAAPPPVPAARPASRSAKPRPHPLH
jgi:hypothetical protein